MTSRTTFAVRQSGEVTVEWEGESLAVSYSGSASHSLYLALSDGWSTGYRLFRSNLDGKARASFFRSRLSRFSSLPMASSTSVPGEITGGANGGRLHKRAICDRRQTELSRSLSVVRIGSSLSSTSKTCGRTPAGEPCWGRQTKARTPEVETE